MTKWSLLLVICSLVGCAPEPLDTTRVALTGILATGEGAREVTVLVSDGGDGAEFKPSSEATVELHSSNGSFWPLAFNGSHYANNTVTIEEGITYRISCKVNGKQSESTVVAPFKPELWSTTATPFAANLDDFFSPVFTVGWLGPDDHSFLLQLVPVAVGDSIRPGEEGTFTENFNGPYDNLQLTLTTADFTYYGTYELHITAIDKAYRALWLEDNLNDQGLLLNGPTNVKGGFGYVAAVSTLVVPLEITP